LPFAGIKLSEMAIEPVENIAHEFNVSEVRIISVRNDH
jgi:hypothetical protein